MTDSVFSSQTLARLAAETASRRYALHEQFLQTRRAGLQNLQTLIAQQIQLPNSQPAGYQPSPALYTSQQLDAFGAGRLADCLGPRFARYAHRNLPRIPNGDLKMMSRIVDIHGTPGTLTAGAWVLAELDLSAADWFFQAAASHQLPFSLLMEAALQPCGFLSAYLDTYALLPDGEYKFRNLDGQLDVVGSIPGPGETIATRAVLLSSTLGAGTMIQRFSFELSASGKTFCRGESTFGYFSQAAMQAQAGLDGGRPIAPPELPQAVSLHLPDLQRPAHPSSRWHLSGGRMNFLDEVRFAPQGGRYAQGYLAAHRQVDPRAWYYPFHFSADPVMPGSLGVEAALEAMQAAALHTHRPESLAAAHFAILPTSKPFIWRYRGQIVPTNRAMYLTVDFHPPQPAAEGLLWLGDVSLWCDSLRIYEMRNLPLGICV